MFIKEILRGIVSNAIAILITSLLLTGFILQYSPMVIITGATVLSLINYFIKPILKAISFPINAITLGFFNMAINVALLYLVVYIVDGIQIKDSTIDLSLINYSNIDLPWFGTLILAAASIGIINFFVRKLLY